MAMAALICGVLGMIGGFIPYVQYVAPLCAIAGIVLGVMARNQAKSTGEPAGMATAGMVLGIVATAVSGTAVACVICASLAVVGMGV